MSSEHERRELMAERRRRSEAYPYPHDGFWVADPVPSMEQIPLEQWRAALAPIRSKARLYGINRLQDQDDWARANEIMIELDFEDAAARQRAWEVVPEPPPGTAPKPGPARQVNFRLSADEHERLREAARLFGLRPASLARVLTVRAMDAALADAERARGDR